MPEHLEVVYLEAQEQIIKNDERLTTYPIKSTSQFFKVK